MKTLTLLEYNHMTEVDCSYHICNYNRCAVGGVKNFKVEGLNTVIKLRCTQVGGIATGSHCFVIDDKSKIKFKRKFG